MDINKFIILLGENTKSFTSDPITGNNQMKSSYSFDATEINSEDLRSEKLIIRLKELIQKKDESIKNDEYEFASNCRTEEWRLIFLHIDLNLNDNCYKASWTLNNTMVYMILHDR